MAGGQLEHGARPAPVTSLSLKLATGHRCTRKHERGELTRLPPPASAESEHRIADVPGSPESCGYPFSSAFQTHAPSYALRTCGPAPTRLQKPPKCVGAQPFYARRKPLMGPFGPPGDPQAREYRGLTYTLRRFLQPTATSVAERRLPHRGRAGHVSHAVSTTGIRPRTECLGKPEFGGGRGDRSPSCVARNFYTVGTRSRLARAGRDARLEGEHHGILER